MANRTMGFGSSFKWHNGTVLTAVPALKSLDGPAMEIESVDTTAMDTPNATRTFAPTLINSGKITLEVDLDPDDVVHQQLISDAAAKTVRAFEIDETDPTPTTRAGSGFITSLEIKRPMDGIDTMSVTIQVSGPITNT